jgi:hypothetical protein
MDKSDADKPFFRLSQLLRALEESFVAEIGVDDQGLVLDPRVGELLGSGSGLLYNCRRQEGCQEGLTGSVPFAIFLNTSEGRGFRMGIPQVICIAVILVMSAWFSFSWHR